MLTEQPIKYSLRAKLMTMLFTLTMEDLKKIFYTDKKLEARVTQKKKEILDVGMPTLDYMNLNRLILTPQGVQNKSRYRRKIAK